MASIEDSCDSINKFKAQLDFFVVQLISMQKACESIISSIKIRLEELKQERQNAPFTTLQVNTSNLEAEFCNNFKEYHKSTINVLRIEILEEIRSLRKELVEVKSSDSVQDDATYTMSPEPEELEDEPQRKRCMSRNKLIVDKATQLSRNDMRARIADVGVELRCESAAHDRVVIRTPASTLLTRPAHDGYASTRALGRALGALFAERMANVGRPPAVERPVEEVLFQRPVQNQVEEIIQAETSIDKSIQDLTIQEHDVQDQVMQDISNRVNISIRNIQDTEAVARDSMDKADLTTEPIISISQKKRASENEKTPKKRRVQRPSTLDRSAEIPRLVLSPNEVTQQSDTEHLTSMLQKASLADFQPRPASAGIEPATLTQHERSTHGSKSSETPLGSLDRTKVTADFKKFIDEQWGVQGTMLKIFHCVVKGVPQITVESLVHRGPVIKSRRRIIAARCFTSILKLHNNGFLKVTKDKETNSIKHIELGPRITKGR